MPLCAVSVDVSEQELPSVSEIKGCSCKPLQLGPELLCVQWPSEACLNYEACMLAFNNKLVFGLVYLFFFF